MNGFKYTAFSSLLLMIFLLVIATLFERMYGSFVVQEYIYHSPLFIALWAVIVVSAVIYIIKVTKRPAVIMLHFAFVLVLLGALISFLTSRRGEVELSLNTVPSSMFVNSEGELEKMPFRLSLLELTTSYDSDLLTPLDYNAVVEVAERSSVVDTLSFSMNNPLVFEHYTFCIKSVAPAFLSLNVSYDPYGLPLTYNGYFLVLLSFILVLVNRESRFRRLLSRVLGREENANSGDGLSHVVGRKLLDKLLLSLSAVTLLVLTVLAAHRWYSTGLFPATNGYEAMFLLAWCSLLFAIVAWRRSSTLFKAMFALALLALSVALLSYDSAGSVIPPILRTPLLGLHVSCMILSYSMLGCTAVNAVVALCYGYIFKNESKLIALADLGRLLLYPATILLAAGIFIGAVWANISWGRYWGWDPKEVWALITMLVCSFTFHTCSLPLMAKPLFFHIFSILVFLLMLFTYFGVNYLLGGFHSYV